MCEWTSNTTIDLYLLVQVLCTASSSFLDADNT
jgi:hypothetical protein